MTTDTERWSRGKLLAEIALSDLPTPGAVCFYPLEELVLDLETVADGMAWCHFLGGHGTPHTDDSGYTYLIAEPVTWRGWSVRLVAFDIDPPDDGGPTSVPAETFDDDPWAVTP